MPQGEPQPRCGLETLLGKVLRWLSEDVGPQAIRDAAKKVILPSEHVVTKSQSDSF